MALRVTDEVEALRAILLDDELSIYENEAGVLESIETLVFPSTGEDSRAQYVCVRLVVNIPLGYPDVSPIINLKNPRGLHEDTVKTIQAEAEEKCRDFIGQPVMFELIEVRQCHFSEFPNFFFFFNDNLDKFFFTLDKFLIDLCSGVTTS